MKAISKYIFWLLITGIGCSVMKLYFAQSDMASLDEGVFPWYYRVAFLGNILISVASILSFFVYQKYFPAFIKFCYLAIIALVIVASLDSFDQQRPTFFYGIKGIGNFINFGILFFAADTRYFPKLLKYFYYLTLVIVVAGLINLSKVGMGASRKDFLLYIRDFTVYLMWVFPYFFLQDETDKTKKWINSFAYLAIFVITLSSGSRSYLFILLLVGVVKYWSQLRTKNGMTTILGLLIACAAGYFVLINSQLAGTFENAFSNLEERSGDDSRSEQIVQFLAQYDTDYLLQGVGPMQKWFWPNINEWYAYLDNQILLTSWWAGLPTALAYVALFGISLFIKSEIQEFEKIKGLKLVLTLWILACLGLGVYCTICTEAYYYFLSCLLGLNACQYTKILEPQDALESAPEYELA